MHRRALRRRLVEARAGGEMSTAEIRECVSRSGSDTLVARAFRRALGLPQRPSRGGSSARVDRYGDLAECFANERRVLV